MTLELLLEKRNATNIPLTVIVDGISLSRNCTTQSHEFAKHSFLNSADNCDNCDCGNCYCACQI